MLKRIKPEKILIYGREIEKLEGNIQYIKPFNVNHFHRRLMILHIAYLHRRGMSAQECMIVDIKCIMHLACRVIVRNVQSFKIIKI